MRGDKVVHSRTAAALESSKSNLENAVSRWMTQRRSDEYSEAPRRHKTLFRLLAVSHYYDINIILPMPALCLCHLCPMDYCVNHAVFYTQPFPRFYMYTFHDV